MKRLLFAFLLFSSITVHSQTNPTLSIGEGNGVARAVVIGISQYDNAGNEDLRFADRDAEVFYDYLRSKAGGNLPENHIKLLTNDMATIASIGIAMKWLKDETKKGDMAIFYFSGHGKVETNPIAEHGFLLASNSPPNNLKNNSIRIEDLDEDAKFLSSVKEAKVIFILDACRSGTIANVGPTLSPELRGKQKENEVRLLSCKADQLSLEDTAWGQGRGLFSYYLVNGLTGLADAQGDGVVTLEELKEYLTANIKKALADGNYSHRQTPVFVGEDETFELARVDEPSLLALQESLKNQQDEHTGMAMVATSSGVGKGTSVADDEQLMEDRAIAAYLKALDLSQLAASDDFNRALESKEDLLQYILSHRNASFTADSPELKAGEAAFNQLAQSGEKDMEASTQLSNFIAIELHNQVQAGINRYLSGDLEELALRQLKNKIGEFGKYPRLMKAIMLMIEPDQVLYRQLEVNYHYCNGVYARLNKQLGHIPTDPNDDPLTHQEKALALDGKASYVHNEMGLIYLMSNDLENAEKHFVSAAELAPGWALPPANLSIVYSAQNKPEQAAASANKAAELQPDYYASYTTLGKIALNKKDYLRAETMYKKAIERNKAHFLAYQKFGEVCLATTRYVEAERNFQIADSLFANVPSAPTMDFTTAATQTIVWDRPLPISVVDYPLHANPKTVKEWMNNGEAYFKLGNYAEAEMSLRKVVELEPKHPKVYELLGQTLLAQGRYEEAALCIERLMKMRPKEPALKLLYADVYQKQGRWVEEEAIYRSLINVKDTLVNLRSDAFIRLIQLAERQERYWEQEQLMIEYEALFGANPSVNRLDFYEKMVQQHPGNLDWLSKQANFYESQNNSTWACGIYRQILQKDSLWEGSGYMHARIGYNASEDSIAISHFYAAIRHLPGLSSPKLDLARIYHQQLAFDQEITVLEDMLNSGQIDFERRLHLADLYMLSNRYDEADSLLITAEKIRLEEVVGLNELRGKLDLLRGQPKTAIGFYDKVLASKSVNNPAEIYFTIARLYAWAGNKDQAWKWLQKAIAGGFKYKLVVRNDETWKDYPQRLDTE